MQKVERDDVPPDSTIMTDAALFLYEVNDQGWSKLGPELRTRPATTAFLLREGIVRTAAEGHELTLAGRTLITEVVRRSQIAARTNLGRRAEAGRVLRALFTEHARSV